MFRPPPLSNLVIFVRFTTYVIIIFFIFRSAFTLLWAWLFSSLFLYFLLSGIKERRGEGNVSHTVLIVDYWSRCIHSACHSRHLYPAFKHHLHISLIFPTISARPCQSHYSLLLSTSMPIISPTVFLFICIASSIFILPVTAKVSSPLSAPLYSRWTPAKRSDVPININSPSFFLALSTPSYLETCAAISQSHATSYYFSCCSVLFVILSLWWWRCW